MNDSLIYNLGFATIITCCPIAQNPSYLPQQHLLDSSNFQIEYPYSTNYDFDFINLYSTKDYGKLSKLYSLYHVKGQPEIFDFLSENEYLIPLMEEFSKEARQVFSISSLGLEIDQEEGLYAVITVNSTPETTVNHINNFNKNYFLNKLSEYRGQFNYQLEQL